MHLPALLLAVAAILTAGCSPVEDGFTSGPGVVGEDDVTEEPAEESESPSADKPAEPSPTAEEEQAAAEGSGALDVARGLAALRSGSSSGYYDLVPEDSKVAAYGRLQGAIAEATLAGGVPGEEVPDYEAAGGSGAAEICVTGSNQCGTVTQVEVNDDGLVVDFSIDGAPVADRMSPSQASVEMRDGSTVQLLGAYESGDRLLVAARVEAADVMLDVLKFDAQYITPAGTSRAVEQGELDDPQLYRAGAIGDGEVRAGTVGFFVFSFPRSELGGSFFVEAAIDDDFGDIWEFTADLPDGGT